MIKAVVKFWGTTQGLNGALPDTFHTYFVVSSQWQTPNGGVASIVPIAAPPLQKTHFPVLLGGERKAFDEAIAALVAEPYNSGLTKEITEG